MYICILFFSESQSLSISITPVCTSVSCWATYHSWVRESGQAHRVWVRWRWATELKGLVLSQLSVREREWERKQWRWQKQRKLPQPPCLSHSSPISCPWCLWICLLHPYKKPLFKRAEDEFLFLYNQKLCNQDSERQKSGLYESSYRGPWIPKSDNR